MQKFMVIERFKPGCWDKVYDRLQNRGRGLPAGLAYLNSWTNREQNICYQLMETSRPELFDEWIPYWSDLVEFEVVPLD